MSLSRIEGKNERENHFKIRLHDTGSSFKRSECYQ